MATTINNTGERTGVGTILGLLVAVIVIALLFIYGLPALRDTDTDTAMTPSGTNINVSLPATDADGNNTGGTEENTTGTSTGQ